MSIYHEFETHSLYGYWCVKCYINGVIREVYTKLLSNSWTKEIYDTSGKKEKEIKLRGDWVKTTHYQHGKCISIEDKFVDRSWARYKYGNRGELISKEFSV